MSARNRITPAIDNIGVPQDQAPRFANAAKDMPELPARRAEKLNADVSPDDQNYSETEAFAAMYDEAALAYYGQATGKQAQGRQVLRLFSKYKPAAFQFALAVLRNDNISDYLDANLSFEPEGSGEAIVRPIQEATFSNASYTETPGSTGEYEWIPNDSNASTETPTTGEQAWFIFGYLEYNKLDTTPYDYVQVDIDDNLGVRRPEYLRNQVEPEGALGVVERVRGPLAVLPGDNLDMDYNVKQTDINSRLWPLGIEVIVQSASEFGGIQDS